MIRIEVNETLQLLKDYIALVSCQKKLMQHTVLIVFFPTSVSGSSTSSGRASYAGKGTKRLELRPAIVARTSSNTRNIASIGLDAMLVEACTSIDHTTFGILTL